MRSRDESTLKEDYDNERHVLSSLRCLNHPSIVRLVTAYSKGLRYSFLFPVADGDLKSFLSMEKLPSPFKSNQDIFEALWSLSSALEAVHDYFATDFNVRQIGCHYDIKPGNILYDKGRFILADFGLSRLKDGEEDSRSLFKEVEGSYIAPECEPADKDFARARVGRASDVWSLGCFLFEILAYMQGGPTMVNQLFTSRRVRLGPHFAYYFHAGSIVNPAVTSYLQKFQMPEYERTCLGSLAAVVSNILIVDPMRRPKVSEVTLKLFHIAQKTILNEVRSQLGDDLEEFDLELEVERIRLRIWGEITGLGYEWTQIPPTAWLQSPHSHEELAKVQETLSQCRKEASSIRDDITGNRKVTYQRYYHFQRLQDALWEILPATVRIRMMSQVEDILLNQADDLSLEIVDSVLDGGAQDHAYNDSNTQWSSRSSYRRIVLLALVKKIGSAIEHRKHEFQDLTLSQELLVGPSTPFHSHLLVYSERSKVKLLVERMQYHESWFSRSEELVERISSISSLRSHPRIKDVVPILECNGYYHDISNHEFHIAHRLPSFAKGSDPKSLYTIFRDCRIRLDLPSLTQKFDLAIKLVSSVLNLHKAGWLHKNICSFNIVCFPEVFSPAIACIGTPWIIGFNYSRSNEKTAFTEGPGYERAFRDYRHPAYLKQLNPPQGPSVRFRSEFEYYSVGIVLLEIAQWRPLHRIAKDIGGDPQLMLERILKEEIPVVKTYMGDFYGEAVKACLTSYSGGPEKPDEARSAFEKQVCIPLLQRLI